MVMEGWTNLFGDRIPSNKETDESALVGGGGGAGG
jgi:hypothetical protein